MNLKNYISEFIDKIEKKSGGEIKYNNKEYYLKLNKFIINNDYSGKQLQKPKIILSENNFKGEGINLNSKLSLSEQTVKGFFEYTHPNFVYSDNLVP